jgi:transcriptional regulator with XRE-family HTH domain
MPVSQHEQETPGGDWDAVAQAIRSQMGRLSITQLELAAKAGVSLATVQELARGVPRKRYGRTLTAVSSALGWPPDRIEQIASRAAVLPDTPQTAPGEINALREELARINRRLDELEADQKGA